MYAYPLEEWKILENKIKTLPLNNKMQEHLSDSFFSGAYEIELDKEFRGFIPQNLDIVNIGVLSRVEIWVKYKWNEYNS